MAEHYDLGKRGEEEARHYLLKKGYKIKHLNWRYAKAELDMVVENDEWLVIVEVKTRSADTYGSPEEFVHRAKQRHLIRAANQYVEEFPTEKDIRFDIISIILEPQFRLEHIEEAFYP